MKRRLLAVICVFSIVFTSGISLADNALDKLKRGAVNVIVSPVEIINGMKQAKEQGKATTSIMPSDGWDSALTWGLLNGALRMVVRGLVGAYEVVTFPVPVPAEYEPLITDVNDPEFFLK